MVKYRWLVLTSMALLLVMPLRSAADVTVTAISQGATTHYGNLNNGLLNKDDDSISFSQIPPSSFSLSSGVAGIGTTSVSLTVTTYSGPSSLGVPAAGLSFIGSTEAQNQGRVNNAASGSSSIFTDFSFTLNVPHPYTFSGSGFGAKLYVSGGAEIPFGSGTLPAGNYGVSLFLSPPSTMNLDIASVPEPGVLSCAMAMATLSAFCRRRSTR